MDHTPTTEEVRFAMAGLRMPNGRFITHASFNRWLANRDAQVLRDAADAWAADPDAWGDNEKDYRNELRDRADLIARTS